LAVRVLSLGSGSSGNALLIAAEGCNLLVDCGVGSRIIAASLKTLGFGWDQLSGVVISHEHSDHIRALDPIVRRKIPIHCSKGTAIGAGLGPTSYSQLHFDRSFRIDAATIHPIPTSHDASEPCGYFIEVAGFGVSVITDTGEAGTHFLEPIRNSQLAVFESNHDEQMLWNGPYPAHLKRRVASPKGHLSNKDCGDTLRMALLDGARPAVWLAHLSETNNRPDVALKTVRAQLGELGRSLEIEALSRRGGIQRSLTPEEPRPTQLSLF